MKWIIGIDLGGTSTKLGLFDQNGTLVEKWQLPTERSDHGKRILPNLAYSSKQALERHKIIREEVIGIGLGVPGAVRGQSYVAPCINLDQWGGFDAAEAFSHLCGGLPVRLVNDANAAALGEIWQGSAKDVKNMLFVTLGTGVGSGVVINGRVVEGAHGVGGEIGHIKLQEQENRTCGCGKHGCLEQYASATGLVCAAHRKLESSDEPSLLRQKSVFSAKEVFDAAKAGDSLAEKLILRSADELGRALASVSCVIDPEVIVLGGGVSMAGQPLLEAVKRSFRRYAFPAAEETCFRLALLDNDAGIYGAAKLMLDLAR